MEDERILELVRRSLKSLFQKDSFLILNDVSERCVAHKFAVYLQERFQEYRYVVDCEYNNDNAWGKKLKSEKMRKHFNGHLFTPDIIVHRRTELGNLTNEHNICIFELKLSTNKDTDGKAKDIANLEFATVYEEGTLAYQLGFNIELWAGDEAHIANNGIRTDVKLFSVYQGGHRVFSQENLNLNIPIKLI